MAAQNRTLGKFHLVGIPPAPRGMPQIEVTFDIDANGILNVTAKDQATAKEQKVTITASTNLNKGEIERMVQQSRQHEAEDRKRRELIEARNQADNLAYQTEKTLRELGEKVPEAERQKIQRKVSDLREALKTEDSGRIQKLSEELQNAFHALSQQLYAAGQQTQAAGQQTQAAGQPFGASGFPNYGNPGGNGNGRRPEEDGEVIEGEFHEA